MYLEKSIHTLLYKDSLSLTSGHEEMVWVQQLEPKEDKDALNGEWATVHKVPIEEVRIGGGGEAIELEDVHKVIELSVDVATHSELGPLRHRHVN